MVQDDLYYLSLGYEYARQRKALDILNDEKQDLPALSIRVKRELKETDKVMAQGKKLRSKEMYYRDKHEHDHGQDRLVFTSLGKVIGTIYAIPSKIQQLIDDDRISPEEFKKMDIVHKTKLGT